MAIAFLRAQLKDQQPMTEDEEKKAREDRAKADADAGTKLDKILSHLDSVGERMDAFNKRMDSFDEKEKAKADAEKAKCDAEEEEAKKKADSEDEKKEDKKADVEDEKKVVAADKKKADADEEDEKADADEEDDKKKEAKADAVRKDSAGLDEIRKEIAKLASVTPRFANDTSHAAYADAQARADSVYQSFGRQAPPSMQAEDLNSYRLRLARELQPHSDAWKNVNLAVIAVDSEAFNVAERDIYAAAKAAALSPANMTEGQERVMTRVDRETGRKTVEFARVDSFVRDHATPAQYCTRFNTDQPRAN